MDLTLEASGFLLGTRELVLNVLPVQDLVVVFFAESVVIRLGCSHLGIMLVDDAVGLLYFRAEGCLRVLADMRHFLWPSLVE